MPHPSPILSYAGPEITSDTPVYRAWRFLVIPVGQNAVTLPPFCIRCGTVSVDPPVLVKIKRSIFRPHLQLRTFFCPRHLHLRRLCAHAAIITAIAGIPALLPYSLVLRHFFWNPQVPMVLGLLLLAFLIGGLSVAASRGPSLFLQWRGHLYLTGISSAFLRQRPQMPPRTSCTPFPARSDPNGTVH